MEDLKAYVDFERFNAYQCAVYDNHLAIATDKQIIVVHKSSLPNSTIFNTEECEVILHENIIEYSRVSLLTWIEESKVCVGFESGLLICYSIRGNEIFRFHGTASSLQQIRILDDNGKKKLWILYEEGLLIMVSLT